MVYRAILGRSDIFGTKRWPDGDNAIPPTRPGPGGNGGALSATLTSCDALSDRRPGNSGSKAPDAHGGPPGQPTYALWMFIDNTRNPTKTTMEPHDTKGGNDAVAPDVDLTIPSAPGPFAKLDEPKEVVVATGSSATSAEMALRPLPSGPSK